MNKILLVPHTLLRQKSKKLNKVCKEDINLSKKMIKIMNKAPGVGLAANQIGILKQIIVVHIQDEEKKIDKIYALFNPTIINYSKETVIMEEGCLSLPKQFAEIERPSLSLFVIRMKVTVLQKKKKMVWKHESFNMKLIIYLVNYLLIFCLP